MYVNSKIPLDEGNGVIKFSHFACLLVSGIMWNKSVKLMQKMSPVSYFSGDVTLQDVVNNSVARCVKWFRLLNLSLIFSPKTDLTQKCTHLHTGSVYFIIPSGPA